MSELQRWFWVGMWLGLASGFAILVVWWRFA
jgi:hypothetical protein